MPKRRSHRYFGEDARPSKFQRSIEPVASILALLETFLALFPAFLSRLTFHNRYEYFFVNNDLSMIDDDLL